MPGEVHFGLLLHCGEMLGADHAAVLRLTVSQADLAERLGYRDVWVTDHHFLPSGINPSALGLASFLLGRTRRLRIGAMVALTPLQPPIAIAEQASLLDQLSHGRFDLGLGPAVCRHGQGQPGASDGRLEGEVATAIDTLLGAWLGDGRGLHPTPRTRPHPPLHVASQTLAGIERAARAGAPLLHSWATPPGARAVVETQYREVAERAGRDPDAVEHVHTCVTWVTDDERRARERLRESLYVSLRRGAKPTARAVRAEPRDLSAFVATLADAAIVGRPESVAECFAELREQHRATRFVAYMEPIWVRAALLESVARFATEVMPHFATEPPLELVGQTA